MGSRSTPVANDGTAVAARIGMRTPNLLSIVAAAYLVLAGCSAEQEGLTDENDANLTPEQRRTLRVNDEFVTKLLTKLHTEPSDASSVVATVPKGARVKLRMKPSSVPWYNVSWTLDTNEKVGYLHRNTVEMPASSSGPAKTPDADTPADTGGLYISRPGYKELNVTFFNQYDSATINPGGSCGNTSAAMVLNFYGIRKTPDGIRESYGHGLKAQYSRSASRSSIKKHLDAGRPVMIHGWFTGPGHVMVVVGYDESAKEWIVNDPSGMWSGTFKGGYSGNTGQNGKGRRYSYSSFSNTVIGSDGDIWITTAGQTEFSVQ
jgi:Peptidase_C39 like family